MKKKFFPLVNDFYNSLSYEQMEKIYTKLITERGFYKKITEKKIVVFKRKDSYLDYYKVLYQDYMMLYEGINKNKFTI